MKPDRDPNPLILCVIIALIVFCVGFFTPLSERITYHLDDLKSRLFYLRSNPAETLFRPQEQAEDQPTVDPTEYMHGIETEVALEVTRLAPTATETPVLPTATVATDAPTPTVTNTPEPTETPEPLPESYFITGTKYETQHGIWNYCAPTNLSMAMTYWGWNGQRTDIGPKVKPYNKDKNVMFYELAEYVSEYSDLRSLYRYGGTAELLKRLIVKGFPILIEKGAFMQEVSGKLSWMGHYNLVTGYDDEAQEWTVQDSYYNADYKVDYETLEFEWKSFNYEFMVVYPGDKEAELYEILGPYTNASWANQNALKIADALVESAETNEDYFYAYFNRGTSQVALNDYYGAAQSYDMAYNMYYPEIESDRRPYRIIWYQTGPYYAYYYSGRYYDVISLAETALSSTAEPYLEEAHYWRAMAYNALGEIEKARDDLTVCLQLHSGFEACQNLLYELGGEEEE